MTTIVTLKNSKAYAVYVDGKKIVECPDPVTTFNELVKNLGVDTSKVEVMEGTHIPDTLQSTTFVGQVVEEIISERGTDGNIEDVINSVNSGTVAKNIGAYKKTGIGEISDNATVSETSSTVKEKPKNMPVGSVEAPELGDLIYVDGVNGILVSVTGGIGTVAMVKDTNMDVPSGTQYEVEENDDDDDSGSDEHVEKNLMIELEEVPGVYFSWTLLRNKQAELQNRYGYKPAQAV